MKKKPNFVVGDTVEYKAGKRGFNFGFNNGDRDIVTNLGKPLSPTDGSEWGGWTVQVKGSNMYFPAAWFRKITVT